MQRGWQRIGRAVRDGGLLPVSMLLIAVLRAATDPETDLFWMAREGQQVLAGGGFTHPDRWSWAPVPGDFVPTSPLWELFAGLAWQHGGRTGLILLTGLALFLCGLGLGWVARSLSASTPAIAVALLLCVAIEPALWTSRAALPALVLLLVALTAFARGLPRLRTAALAPAVAVVALGAFAAAVLGIALHGSWTAYAVALAAGLLWLAAPAGRRAAGVAALGGVAAVLGASCGPLGFTVWRQAGRVAAAGHGVITEWTSPWRLGAPAIAAYLAGSLLLLLTAPVLRRRSGQRPLLALLVLFAVGAQVAGLAAERFSFLAMGIAMPVVALALSRGLPRRLAARLEPRLGERLHEPYWRLLLTMVAVAFLPVALLLAPSSYSVLDAPAFAALPSGCALFSDDGTASAAVLMRPDVRPWIDGRLDYWGTARMVRNRNILDHPLPSSIVPAGSTCVALPTGSYPVITRALDAAADWQALPQGGPVRAWARR